MHLFKSFLLAIFAVLFLSRCGGSDGAGTSAEAGAGSGKIESQNKKTSWNGDADVGKVAQCIVGDYSTEDKAAGEVSVTIHVRANNAKGSLLFVAREKEGSNRAFCSEFSNINTLRESVFFDHLFFDSPGVESEHFGAIGTSNKFTIGSIVMSGITIGDEGALTCGSSNEGVGLDLSEGAINFFADFEAKKVESVSGNYESLLNDCKNSSN